MAAPTTQNEVTVRRLSTLITGVWDKVKTLVSDKAPLASPALTGTPTAPTAAAGTDTTQIATTAFVKQAVVDGLSTGDAMVYKGTIVGGSTGSYGALTGAASKGWTYKVTTAGKIDGVAVEVGDMLICNSDDTEAATSSNYSTVAAKWDFVQANIDGAVIGPASVTSGRVATFDGTTGKLIKDSGYTIAKSVPSDAKFTDTTYTFDGTYNASTNKAATVSTVTNAIGALDVSNISGFGAGKTLSALSETDGKISATFQNISITKSQVSDFPTSMTPTSHASSGTGYGVGTTSNYGHVKLATGDMNGASGADGVACGKNHTHSQYAVPNDITTAINALAVDTVGGDHKYISGISQYAGKISATATMMDSYPTENSIKAVESGGIYSRLAGKVDYVQNTSSSTIASDAPFSSCKTYFEGNSMTNDTIKMVYNTPGLEKTLIFSKNDNYGTILRWGYTDRYLYIARKEGGSWKASDWEKISAGYADSAGSATKAAQDQNGNVINTTYLPRNNVAIDCNSTTLKSSMALSASYATFDTWRLQPASTWQVYAIHAVIEIVSLVADNMTVKVRCVNQNSEVVGSEHTIRMIGYGTATVPFALNCVGNSYTEQILCYDGGGSAPKVAIKHSYTRLKISI